VAKVLREPSPEDTKLIDDSKIEIETRINENGNEAIKDEEKAEKRSRHVVAKQKYRDSKQKLDPAVGEQFQSGRLLACISSRPGQSGRADGYVLEGEELAFYIKKIAARKGKKAV